MSEMKLELDIKMGPMGRTPGPCPSPPTLPRFARASAPTGAPCTEVTEVRLKLRIVWFHHLLRLLLAAPLSAPTVVV